MRPLIATTFFRRINCRRSGSARILQCGRFIVTRCGTGIRCHAAARGIDIPDSRHLPITYFVGVSDLYHANLIIRTTCTDTTQVDTLARRIINSHIGKAITDRQFTAASVVSVGIDDLPDQGN